MKEDMEMKKNLTEMVMILDRSGSMGGLEKDTIGGYNSLIAKQKAAEGDALVTTVLFDHDINMIFDRVSITKVPDLTEEEYYARGTTALLDAIGSTLTHIESAQIIAGEAERPEKTIFMITTDGLENASHVYNYEKVRKMIERKQEEGWEFMFLGAGIDAIREAAKMGIGADFASNYVGDAVGTRMVYSQMADAYL